MRIERQRRWLESRARTARRESQNLCTEGRERAVELLDAFDALLQFAASRLDSAPGMPPPFGRRHEPE